MDVRLSRPGQATQPVAELPLRMPLHACILGLHQTNLLV